MGLRDVIQKSPVIGVVLAVVLVVVAAMVLARSGSKPAAPQGYYYDLSTGKVFVHTQRATPPIDAPDGGAGKGVRAHVYGCGDCSEANRRVGYIEMYSEQAVAAMAAVTTDEQQEQQQRNTIMQGRLVAWPPESGAEPRWVSGETPQGQTIISGAASVCGSGDGSGGGKRCKPQ